MMVISVIALNFVENMTASAVETLKKAETVFLQTSKHPFAKTLSSLDVPCISMDDLYETAEDYDSLHVSICKRMIESRKNCVFAATGSFVEIINVLKDYPDVQVSVLPYIPFYINFFSDQDINCTFSAADILFPLSTGTGIVITEITNRIIAGEIKIKLMDQFPEDIDIQYAYFTDDGVMQKKNMPLYQLDSTDNIFNATSSIYIRKTSFSELKRFSISDLEYVIDSLRAPDGCPWDREQTHESIKRDLIEECYEVLDAIDKHDDNLLCEELGDVLMHLVFHASIAKQEGAFTFSDVVSDITNKMIYRHPHVFGNLSVDTSEQVVENWDKLKAKEKNILSVAGDMDRLPKSLPSLIRAQKVQKKASKVGFDWDKAEDAFYKVEEEIKEVREAWGNMDETFIELGDLLFAIVNTIRLLKGDSENIMNEATEKFIRRFRSLEMEANRRNTEIDQMTLQELDLLWEKVKKAERI